MHKGWQSLLLLSLIVNIIGLFIAFKAYDYRKKMILAWAQSHEWISEFNHKFKLFSSTNDSVEIVFLGASITANWDLKRYFPDRQFINKGIDGQFSGQLLLRFQHDVVDLHPRAVVIKLCEMNFSHDLPFEVMRDNILMITKLAMANDIRPFLVSVLPVTIQKDRSRQGHSINKQVLRFNEWLVGYCAEHQFPFVDMSAALADGKGNLEEINTKDGVHPNETGYAKMAAVLSQTFAQEEL